MARFDGYLFSKLALIGTKSEGPSYFLQQWDYGEIPVVKRSFPWAPDPQLHPFLGRKVTIWGEMGQEGIHYYKITDLVEDTERAFLEPREGLNLDVQLSFGETLVVHKGESAPPTQAVDLTLSVQWPHRSIWRGECPTSQLYDFFIERNGEIVTWWSKNLSFLQVITTVEIPGGSPVPFPVRWFIYADDIQEEGTYTMRARFIASGQEVKKTFNVKFD
jgi:hypothetical protein